MVKSEPILKRHCHWLVLAGLAAAVWLGTFVYPVWQFSNGVRDFPTPFRVVAVVIPLLVLLAVVIMFTIGNKIIPWRYTLFGPYERSPPPKGFQPHIVLDVAPRQPNFICRFAIGKAGIELTFQLGSRAFLPASAITAIGPGSAFTYVVEHDSEEIASPLLVSPEVGEAILAGLSPGSHHKA